MHGYSPEDMHFDGSGRNGRRRGGGISTRAALMGAVFLVIVSSGVTYFATTLAEYRYLWGGAPGPRERLATLREISDSPGFERFLSVLTLVRKNYVDRPDMEKLLQGAAEGAVQALNDPYSSFFTVKEFEHFHKETSDSYGGIGVQVTDEGKYTVVVSAFPGTPGATTPFEGARPGDPKGLRSKDKIVQVDERNIVGLDKDKAVELIRGEPGTKVRVVVLRELDGVEQRLTFNITRARIQVPTTVARMLAPGVGYLHITQFLESTPARVKEDLAKLKADGARAIVLDLRHNPGGRLDAAVDIAGLFVPKGPVVHVVDRSGRRETYVSNNPAGLGMPLVVLVDEASASASEILAGAIQDRRAGTLVGERTFGKGLVQQVWDLEDGTGLKLTVSKYLTPNNRDINRKRTGNGEERDAGGLQPDILVPRPEKGFEFGVQEKDPQLARALAEAQLRLAKTASR